MPFLMKHNWKHVLGSETADTCGTIDLEFLIQDLEIRSVSTGVRGGRERKQRASQTLQFLACDSLEIFQANPSVSHSSFLTPTPSSLKRRSF